VASADEVALGRLVNLVRLYLPLRAMAWFRFASWLKRRGVPALPGVIQRHLLTTYGLELSPGADIGGGLYIAHPVGCVVQAERIGRNVTIIGPVTIGYRNTARWPRIGDDVYIGTGARVLGDIELGDGCRVGANAVVLHDVPAGATVVGIPARVVGERTQGV
jgi:serine O-acetyltransferase